MFRSNSIKFFCVFVFVLSFSTSCSWWKTTSDAPAPPQPFAPEEIKSDIPFSTKEPENFSAEFVVTANNRETVTFVARAENKRRFDYNFGAKNQLTVLHTAANQNILILPDKKLYAESNNAATVAQAAGNFRDSLTNEWLNTKADAKFTNAGAENGLTKYSVRLNDSDVAETIVFVDEKINLPVRQEFYSIAGGQKTLTYTLEVRNFKTEAESGLFEIPKNFRKVSPESLRAAMREITIDEK